jgi:hypothetical protein
VCTADVQTLSLGMRQDEAKAREAAEAELAVAVCRMALCRLGGLFHCMWMSSHCIWLSSRCMCMLQRAAACRQRRRAEKRERRRTDYDSAKSAVSRRRRMSRAELVQRQEYLDATVAEKYSEYF